jgi:hypothetical protein
MSNSASTGWSSGTEDSGYVRRKGPFVLKGLSIGLLAGMGAFVYNGTQFLPFEIAVQLLLVPMLLAGGFARLFASSLRESVRLALAGFFVGLATFVGAWVAPLWILSYSPVARDVLLPKLAGNAISAGFLTFSPAYLTGYLLIVSVSVLWE